MRNFIQIEAGVIKRFGGISALEAHLSKPKSQDAIRKISEVDTLVFSSSMVQAPVREVW